MFPHATKATLLEKMQQLDLHEERHVAYLIKKKASRSRLTCLTVFYPLMASNSFFMRLRNSHLSSAQYSRWITTDSHASR